MATPSPEPIALRCAKAADEPLIRGLVRSNNLNPLSVHWERFTLATRGEGGPVVGIGQIKIHGDGSRELASIAVVPEARGQGIARLLIEHLLADETGDVWLTCRPELRAFYRPFGFVDVEDPGSLPPYFRRIARIMGWLRRVGVDFGPAILRRNAPRTD